jgi:hypothetical protein
MSSFPTLSAMNLAAALASSSSPDESLMISTLPGYFSDSSTRDRAAVSRVPGDGQLGAVTSKVSVGEGWVRREVPAKTRVSGSLTMVLASSRPIPRFAPETVRVSAGYPLGIDNVCATH